MTLRRFTIALFLVLSALSAFPTAQLTERINDKGAYKGLCSLLLELDSISFSKLESRIPQDVTSTGLWRNYIACWKIKNDSLFLDSILVPDKQPEKYIPVGIDDIYGERSTESGYFANWVTDTLRLVSGDVVNYVHMGWGSTWQHEERIAVEKGIVKDRVLSENRLVHPGVRDTEMLKMRDSLDVGEIPARILLNIAYSSYDSEGNPVGCNIKVVRSCGDKAVDDRVVKATEQWLLNSRPLPILYINGRYHSPQYTLSFPAKKNK